MPTHRGSCHCGAVAFEVEAPAVIEALACNCSICRRCNYVQMIVPSSRFRLLRGADATAVYTFNTHVAQHTFCKTCGVKPYYVPRSNPDGYAVNVHCLDPSTIVELRVAPFDGQSWERHAASLAHLSRE